MISFYRKYYKTAIDIGLVVLTVFLTMWVFSYMYKIAAPVFFSFFIFLIIEPFARFLNRKGIKKSIATALSMLLFILVVLGAFIGGGALFINQITALTSKITEYQAIIQKEIIAQVEFISSEYQTLPDNVTDQIKSYASTLTKYGADFATWFLTNLTSILSSFSTFIVNFFIGLILAYFLSVEIADWKSIAKEKTPNTFKSAFYFLKDYVLKGIVSYIKAQFKLISLTFVVIFISLLIFGVNNAFSVSLLAAVFDLLPLLGVSTVFLPWVIYLFIVGNISLAIKLTVVWAVVIGLRQILEPKIVGDSLGVSAFTMLTFMIISLSLFGIAGLILAPILTILIKELYVQGYLQNWIRLPEEEFHPKEQ
ncbi:sporulation integral membrane protein YtvI [Chengkuizengella marina]|uniref:Sporulation integral membrane protein YtvI n=1 Tax=Chengkuizengella marina TaxID=2507566 RepID=A0A6N9Q5E1_9BACL|nr:sporulation integral membrane protein YtvI [Chengkuizengella marina]NBI29961.1 sporulation integral membrane protein YtvI [Chengkuizengella marina]